MSSWYEWYWLVFPALVFFVGFLPVEIIAIRDDKPGGTLSETVWQLLYPAKDSRHYRYRRWLRIGFAAGLGWVSIHLLSGGWF